MAKVPGKATINYAVLGVGRMGYRHAQVLSRQPGAKVHGVYDAVPTRTQAVAADFGATPYRSWQDALQDPVVDAVFIVTPSTLHHEMCLAAAAAGKAIFCEKPLALTVAHCDAVAAAVEKNRVLFQLGFMRRFDPGYAAARAAIEAGEIGDVVAYNGISRDKEPPPEEYVKESGGIYQDALTHEFDLARYLMGDEVVRLYAAGKPLINSWFATYGDVDHALITLEFRRGGLGHIEGSRNGIYGYDIRGEVMGTKGTIQIGQGRQTPVLIQTASGVRHDFVPGWLDRFAGAYEAEVAAFHACVREQREPLVGAWDGRQALLLALAAAESQRTGLPIAIGEDGSLTTG